MKNLKKVFLVVLAVTIVSLGMMSLAKAEKIGDPPRPKNIVRPVNK